VTFLDLFVTGLWSTATSANTIADATTHITVPNFRDSDASVVFRTIFLQAVISVTAVNKLINRLRNVITWSLFGELLTNLEQSEGHILAEICGNCGFLELKLIDKLVILLQDISETA
jgi:hypothetical protein